MATPLDPGATYQLHTTVNDARTAAALADPGEAVPPVCGTPFMIADMERACAALLAPLLQAGEVSVGARIEVSHSAPTPSGASITATATFTERDGPLYWFDVQAEDAGGRIGKGRIARAIVDQDTLLAKAGVRT